MTQPFILQNNMCNIFNMIKVNFCNSNVMPSQTQSKLEVNGQIVKAFISHLSKFRKQFSAFSVANDIAQAANDIAHRLQRIEWIASRVIRYIQNIQGALKVT